MPAGAGHWPPHLTRTPGPDTLPATNELIVEMWMKPITFGVHLQSRAPADPTTQPNPSHIQMLEDAVRAEQVGLDAVWVPDHYYFQMPWGLETYPEAWTLMTAIAMRTERVRIGSD